MKVIGQLSAGIGHNLRTPLSVILSTVDLIRVHCDGNQKIAGYAENIAHQGARMAEIIENLMERCEKTRVRKVERFSINHILRKELDFMEGNLDFKHKVVKRYNFDVNLPEIEGSCGDFSQTFVNLIDNAIDAMYKSEVKELRICTRHDENNIYVDVEDTGCGITEKEIEKIFDFSFTTKAPLHEGGGPSGMGLGLFNSKHLMDKYGAQIKVKSRPGATAFTVQIPLRQEIQG
jgi:signal transduction histidine kinase